MQNMGGKSNISSYRAMLDKTLASEELKNVETLKTLVKNQILKSSQFELKEHIENVVQRRTKELSNLLGMLRSASENDAERLKLSEGSHTSWKVKQDTEELRVMYREGPEGTPFHTLLVEGYVDGPVDVCLCISWESALYKKWWPQTAIPSFRITSSQCLQKVRIGEQISLVRMKVSWPLSTREALIHYFEFEYFEDGLVVVLLNSISDLESIDKSTHGFTRDGIPDPDDVVRIDVVGGFALQKVSPSRSYFRTIANMDIKLDFVPPAFINFVSRQLIGSGFKLYKKEVASVAQGDEDFGKALKDPLYEKLCAALYSDNISSERVEPQEIKHDGSVLLEERPRENSEHTNVEQEIQTDDQVSRAEVTEIEGIEIDAGDLGKEQPVKYNEDADLEKVQIDDQVSSPTEDSVIGDKRPICEIEEMEEEDTEESKCVDEDSKASSHPRTNQILTETRVSDKMEVVIRPEVKKALGTLEKAIFIIREHKSNLQNGSLPSISIEKPNLEENATKECKSSKPDHMCQNGGTFTGLPKKESTETQTTSYEPRNSSGSHGSRRTGSSSFAHESNHSKVAPASPDEFVQDPGETHHTDFYSDTQTGVASSDKTTVGDNALDANPNGVNEEMKSKKKKKNLRCCCLYYVYGQ